MKNIFTLTVALLLAAGAAGCTGDRDEITRVLVDQGYTEVEVLGYDLWGCGRDDNTATKFRAKGPTGRPVRGVVCGTWSGWGKGYTVRTY